jgi:hypothetical protein
MNTSALFGNSAWIVIGLGVALIVLGLFLKAKSGNSSISFGGSHNTVNQSIQINGGGPPQGSSWMNGIGNFCSIAGFLIGVWQVYKMVA